MSFLFLLWVKIIPNSIELCPCLLLRAELSGKLKKISSVFINNPWLLLLLSFIILILLGTFLLECSFFLDGERSVSLVDTFAISTSAATVTGLWFCPQFTLSEFSTFGQTVILALIQMGGLGAMTAGAFLLIFLRGRLTLTEQEAMRDLLDQRFLAEVTPLIITIVTYTLIIEGIGFFAFLSQWIKVYPFSKALFYSLFHAVSCFCNAGFTLYADNFMRYQSDLLINLVSMSLIILGGIGFLVLFALKDKISSLILRQEPKRLDLHTKIVLFSTVFLIFSGALVFFAFESGQLNLSWKNKILVSFFQSITARTAGFNTVEIGDLSSPTLFFFTILMFIGAGPLSTSGGIKVTTFSLSMLLVWSILKRSTKIEIWKHSISEETLWRGMSIIIISLLMLGIFLVFLLASENFAFEKILFELISAFGTAGLSTGITPYLSAPGKICISLMMFFGRLGPMSLVYAMAGKVEKPEIYLVEDRSVIVG